MKKIEAREELSMIDFNSEFIINKIFVFTGTYYSLSFFLVTQ